MNVIKRNPVPIYSVVCYECNSEIEYTASETSYGHITCPVCGVCLWANTINPKRYEEPKEEVDGQTYP